jgi:hypothetical protein
MPKVKFAIIDCKSMFIFQSELGNTSGQYLFETLEEAQRNLIDLRGKYISVNEDQNDLKLYAIMDVENTEEI